MRVTPTDRYRYTELRTLTKLIQRLLKNLKAYKADIRNVTQNGFQNICRRSLQIPQLCINHDLDSIQPRITSKSSIQTYYYVYLPSGKSFQSFNHLFYGAQWFTKLKLFHFL